MSAQDLFGTVVHLKLTGHVLAAVSSGQLEPTLDQLTGGSHLRVRMPDEAEHIDVPVELLAATRLAITPDVLDRSQWYVLGTGDAPLELGDPPVIDDDIVDGVAGKKVVVVWQTPERAIPVTGVLDADGNPPEEHEPGVTARLVAFEGGPLHIVKVT